MGLVVLFNLRGNAHQALITLLIREAILCRGVVFDVQDGGRVYRRKAALHCVIRNTR